MPVQYQFINIDTNEAETLNNIDIEMCLDQNIICDPNRYCCLFQICQLTGTVAEIQDDSGCVNLEKLEKYLKERDYLDMNEEQIILLKKYLCGKYKFVSWYKRHKSD